MQGFLVIIGLILCYMAGRGVMRAMGLVMFGTLSAIIIQPIIFGFFAIVIVLGVIGLLFKLLLWCAPFILIIGLIIALIRSMRRRY